MMATQQSGSGVSPLNRDKTQRRDASATLVHESPFNQRRGLGKAHQLFGEQLPKLLDEINEVLAA